MKPLYSATSRGFYFREIHGKNVPSDAVSITESEYLLLLNKQVESFSIQPDVSGRPMSTSEDIGPNDPDLNLPEVQ